MSRSHRPRGAQPGNRNGLKHGLYSGLSYTPQEEDHLAPEGYADELERATTITRMTIRSLLQKEPLNERLLSYNVSLLVRLIRTSYLLSQERNERHRRAVEKLGEGLSITSGPHRSLDGSC